MRQFTNASLCLGIVILWTHPALAEKRQAIDRIAAVIDSDMITLRELEEKAAPYMGALEGMTDPKEREQKKKEILTRVLDIEISEKMIQRELIANRERLGVAEQDIDRAIDTVERDNHISREQLQAALYGQGMTWSEYRKKLREQIERSRLIQYRMQGKVQVKEGDVIHRCEQRVKQQSISGEVCASHILMAVPPHASQEEVKRLESQAARLQAELVSGADFSAYALEYSDDKAAPDGRLGCFGKGEMVQAFETAAFALPVGAISSVVRTPFGFHIIKVYDKKTAPGGSCQNENVLDTLRNELYQEEMERQMTLWVNELRLKAFVEIRL